MSGGGGDAFVDLELGAPLLTGLVEEMPAEFAAIRRTWAEFVIDHYGRTLSAISLLRHGFVSGFKIDKSLMLELAISRRVRMMFRTIAALGKASGSAWQRRGRMRGSGRS